MVTREIVFYSHRHSLNTLLRAARVPDPLVQRVSEHHRHFTIEDLTRRPLITRTWSPARSLLTRSTPTRWPGCPAPRRRTQTWTSRRSSPPWPRRRAGCRSTSLVFDSITIRSQEAAGGDVASTAGTGTTFTIRMPLSAGKSPGDGAGGSGSANRDSP
jgi:hypothetical protein